MLRGLLISLLLTGLAVWPATAYAQTGFDGSAGGALIIGYDSSSCDSSIEGAVRYKSSAGGVFTPSLQTCVELSSCLNVGDLCSDGSIFAGDTDMYVTDTNQTASQWKATTGNDDINPDSLTDGATNHANVTVPVNTLPAMDVCETLDRHGHEDWYLPAQDELDVLYTNKAAIDVSAVENFTTSFYWSSSEDNTFNAWRQLFGGGSQGSGSKVNSSGVRCVRRSAPPAPAYDWTNWGADGSVCNDTGSQDFTTPTASGSFTVTSDMVGCTFDIIVKGAGGGAGDINNGGGDGGGASFDFVPSAAGDFDILVGEGGKDECAASASIGGGAEGGEGGGGGASAIAFDGTLLAIAGGGGGMGGSGSTAGGGKGGDPVSDEAGGQGDHSTSPAGGGSGGTGGAGGDDGGINAGGDAGSAGTGHDGLVAGAGYATFNVGGGGAGSGGCGSAGGGGGGGGYGGGGGGEDGGSGGGGGSYLNASETSNASSVTGGAGAVGINSAGEDGSVSLSWGP